MDCARIRELEAAFALDALDEADARAVREHLAECEGHGEVRELQYAAAGLALAGDEQAPPPGLRARVLDSANAAAEEPQGRARRGIMRPRWLAAAAVVAIVIAAGSVAALVTNTGGDDGSYVHEFDAADSMTVRVEATLGESGAAVIFDGMRPLDEGEEYRLWAIRGDNWLSLGAFQPNASGGWSGEFDFALQEGDSLCLTVQRPDEPSGPFGDPVFIEPL